MSNRRRPSSLDLSLGEPALPPDRGVITRALAATAESWGYTPNAGLPLLRSAIARHHALPGRTSADNVIVTVGSAESIFLSLLASVDPGEHVLVPEPGYPAYAGIVRLIGATAVPYPVTRETHLSACGHAIAERLTPLTRVLVVNEPSNPFGTFTSAVERDRIAAVCEAHHLTLIADEVYRDLVYGGEAFTSIAERVPRSILISGLSKSCALTGFRLGYLIAEEHFVRHAIRAHQLAVSCAPTISQHAALAIFENPEFLRAHLPFYQRAREAVIAAAEAHLPADAPLQVGDGAFYATLDISTYGDPLQLAFELLEAQDVVVVPGTAFGPSGNWFWRISYAAGAQAVTEGIRRIGVFLRSRREPA